jgi:hypothetical protein
MLTVLISIHSLPSEKEKTEDFCGKAKETRELGRPNADSGIML